MLSAVVFHEIARDSGKAILFLCYYKYGLLNLTVKSEISQSLTLETNVSDLIFPMSTLL